MIKLLTLSDEKRKKLVSWLTLEIDTALRDRSELEGKWKKWVNQFEAKPEGEVKNFPFERASNLVVPLQSIIVNTFVARQYNTIWGIKPLWTVTPKNPAFSDAALPTQNHLEHVQANEMKMKKQMIPWLYEMGNFGTGFAKIPWALERKMNKKYGPSGEIVRFEQLLSDGPRFIPIPIQDMIFPAGSTDIQSAHWCCHRTRVRFSDVVSRTKRGVYYPDTDDKVKQHIMRWVDQVTEEREKAVRIVRGLEIEEYEIFEVWLNHDYDGDEWDESIVLTLHKDSGTLCRATLFPFEHMQRPFIGTHCYPRPHSIYGIGYGQKLERLQDGLTTVINQAIDNNSVANTKAFKARKGKGIKPNQKLYTGKFFMLDDLTDLEAFDLGTLNPSVLLPAQFIQNMAERDTSVSDYSLGRESSIAKTSTTATSTLALIQEGTKQFDFLLNNTRDDLTEVAYQVHSLYGQFKPGSQVIYLQGEKEGELVQSVWAAMGSDLSQIRSNLGVDLTASSAYINQQMERESWRLAYDMILGFYTKIFEVGQILATPGTPPQLSQLLIKMILSGQLIMTRIMNNFPNVKDVDRLLISPEDVAGLGGIQPVGIVPGANPGATAGGVAGGMEGVRGAA